MDETKQLTHAYIDVIMRLHRMPINIVLYQDTQFTFIFEEPLEGV